MAVRLMRDFVHIEELKEIPVQEREMEIVERKGKGHPDTLIDGACEAVSRALCEYYLKEYGAILHHNVDKGLLVGGRSNPKFAGGDVVEPIYILVAGRATSFAVRDGGVEAIPVGGIAISSIKKFLRSNMRYLEPEKHAIVDYRIKQGSADLMALREGGGIPLCNDTSVGVGYAPLTPTEKLVIETERFLNSRKRPLEELGEDIKVMAYRRMKTVNLTVAAATVSGLVKDKSHYQSVIEEAQGKVLDLATRFPELSVTVKVNSGDNYSKDVYYLTVTGTSAESGDDGNTGRGNRPNGLIAPLRQYSMEATAGKNPVNHTGKIFNVIAQRASDRIYKEVKGIKEVYVRILSRIGVPISQPQVASAAVLAEEGLKVSSLKSDIGAILEEELLKSAEVTKAVVRGEVQLF